MGNQSTTASESESLPHSSDSAAIFASALSLWNACKKSETGIEAINLSETYNGMDQFMREVMRVADLFERWACLHIAFEELSDVWPYLLEDKFGDACLALIFPYAIGGFNEDDCLRAALHLQLPIKADGKLPIPIDVEARNPISGSTFVEFRIQTVRDSIENEFCSAFTLDDDPFDEEFGSPYFTLYGVDEGGQHEAIADRQTYVEALNLARNLVPGIEFPDIPFVVNKAPQ